MATRSKRLWSGSQTVVGGGNVLVYTAPAGETVLLKTLVFDNQAAVAAVIDVKLGSGTANVLSRQALAPGEHRVVETWLVIPASTPVNISSAVAAVRCQGHGAELEGVTD